MTNPDAGKTVMIDGNVVGELFSVFAADGDSLIDQLRKRAAFIGASFCVIDENSGLGEGSTSKYLSGARAKQLTVSSTLRIAQFLGLKVALVVDPELVRQHQANWGTREAGKAHNTGRQRRRTIAADVAEQDPAPSPAP